MTRARKMAWKVSEGGLRHECEYGYFVIERWARGDGATVRRIERYHPNDGREPIVEWSFAASLKDVSPRHDKNHGYNARCSCCWLGFTHTDDYHARAVA
jgi:hypothetical protein